MTRVLGIETSCDETSAAVLEGSGDDVRQRSLVILSQDIHRVFGGVVPEIASRAHLTSIVPVVERALADAGVHARRHRRRRGDRRARDSSARCSWAWPTARRSRTRAGSRWSACTTWKDISSRRRSSTRTPCRRSPRCSSPAATRCCSTSRRGAATACSARTRDDAAGEAFDKVAKLLGLPYPGGPHIERAAADRRPERASASRGRWCARNQRPGDADYYDVSFSGLKTAVRLATQKVDVERRARESRARISGCAHRHARREDARAARENGRTRVVLGGGVACNRTLVARMRERLADGRRNRLCSIPRLATDNAAMIARAGLFRFERGERASARPHRGRLHSPFPALVAA